MGRATAGERRRPRLLSRALLVLGGATAATAAAWLLSSQTASADPLSSVPSAPAVVQGLSTSDTSATLDTAVTSFETPLSTTVSAVTEPSQRAVLPLPTVPATTTPVGLDQLTTGLRGTVGRLGDRLPVERDLPTQLVQHFARTPVSPPAAPSIAVPAAAPVAPHHITVQDGPFVGQHSRIGGVVGSIAGPFDGGRGTQPAPRSPGSVPFPPLTVPGLPGTGGSSGGSAGPAGLGLTTGDAGAILPEPHVVDVLAPATEPVAVLPGKQPGVTPD